MSGKPEKNESSITSANSRVLQKARSFRDEFKHRIRRSPSTHRDKLSVSSSSTGSSHKHDKSSPKGRKKLNRGSSFKEESKTEKVCKQTDVERLNVESKKVHHALLGLRVVVEKGMLHMLPGSATVVLETVMEVSQLLGNFLVDHDSTLLLSAYKKVNQSLANLVKWSDEILMQEAGTMTVNKDTFSLVIKDVEDGVKDLLKLAVEKLENKSIQTPYTNLPPKSPGVLSNGSGSNGSKRSSLPDLPLTPREQEILDLTGDHLNYSNNNKSTTPTTKSPPVNHNHHPLWNHHSNDDDVTDAAAPPKPPLPSNFKAALMESSPVRLQNGPTSGIHSHTPPALPPKKLRSPSSSSLYDNLDPNTPTPTEVSSRSPNAVDALWSGSGIGAATSQNHASNHRNHFNYDPSEILSRGSSSSNNNNQNDPHHQFRHNSDSTSCNSNMDFIPGELYQQRPRLASDEVTLRYGGGGGSDSVVTESIHSSAIGSNSSTVNNSYFSSDKSSKINDPESSCTASTLGGSRLTIASSSSNPDPAVRLSHYDNFTTTQDGIEQGKSSQEENEVLNLTEQIKQLTVNAELDLLDLKPPLPTKKGGSGSGSGIGGMTQHQHLSNRAREHFMRAMNSPLSQYDNFVVSGGGASFTRADTVDMTSSSVFSSLNSSSVHTQHKYSAMKTSHSAFEFSSSSSSSSSASSSSVSGFARQLNATASLTKAQQIHHQQTIMAGKSVLCEGGGLYEKKQAAFSTSSVAMRNTVHGNLHSFPTGDSLLHPPPLPPKIKKKTIEEYMGVFGQYTSPNFSDMARHSLHAVTFYKTQFQQHQMELFHPLTFSRSNTLSILSDISSGAGSGRGSDVFSVQSASSDDTTAAPPTPPFPPKLPIAYDVDSQSESSSPEMRNRHQNSSFSCALVPSFPSQPPQTEASTRAVTVQVVDPNDRCRVIENSMPITNGNDKTKLNRESTLSSNTTTGSTLTSWSDSQDKDRDSTYSDVSSILDDIDVKDQLVRKQEGEDAPTIRGGTVDALIVYATTAGRKEILFQEAFLTTYRTFISPKDLIDKLLYRYHKFSRMEDVKKKKLSRNAFSFLIRVIDELCAEIDNTILQICMDLVFQLLSQGELMLAKILRRKVLEKVELKKQLQLDNTHHMTLWESHHMTTKQYSLLEFKPETIAEQMTLLDSELFQKIEIPEVLLWARYQNEEQSPNLTKFTEHFNKMSYWCRTQILQQEDAKEREKFLVKFIKIMKHLRKNNNFNSYLAILSALDSAPVRRLEWQKQNVEALKELSQLIESSSSFRNYRDALRDTEPPCIPYIGIILQDLTFIHIGNPDILAEEGCLNFTKRWQQFQVLDSMKRFKKCDYEYKKNHKIIAFFNQFEEGLSEESLWQISEALKPRVSHKKKAPEL